MKITVKGFITSKESELYSDCADHYAFDTTNHKFAISDGVSRSFFPKIWSRILVEQFVKKNSWNENEFVEDCQKLWQKEIDEIVESPGTKYFTRNAYNRKTPGLATFVGLQILPDKQEWISQALGDSFLFFVPKNCIDFENEIIKLSSKDEPIEFDNYPDYLSSIGDTHKGKKRSIKEKKLEEGTFYLMTDALAEWFLQGKGIENSISTINNIKTQEQFIETIDNERKSNRLQNDDCALLVIEVSRAHKSKTSYKEINVSTLSQLIPEQEKLIEQKKKEKESENLSSSVDNEEEPQKTEDSKGIKAIEFKSGAVTNILKEENSKEQEKQIEKEDPEQEDSSKEILKKGDSEEKSIDEPKLVKETTISKDESSGKQEEPIEEKKQEQNAAINPKKSSKKENKGDTTQPQSIIDKF